MSTNESAGFAAEVAGVDPNRVHSALAVRSGWRVVMDDGELLDLRRIEGHEELRQAGYLVGKPVEHAFFVESDRGTRSLSVRALPGGKCRTASTPPQRQRPERVAVPSKTSCSKALRLAGSKAQRSSARGKASPSKAYAAPQAK